MLNASNDCHHVVDEAANLLNGQKTFRTGGQARAKSSSFHDVSIFQYVSLIVVGFAIGILLFNIVSTSKEDRNESFSSGNLHTHAMMTKRTSRYTQFQALGYQLYTGGAPVFIPNEDNTSHIQNPECDGLRSHGALDGEILQCYLGHDNLTRDVTDRVAIMQDAVERAYQLADPSPTTLKIFVAPEFFFRGPNGAYIYPADVGEKSERHLLYKDFSNACLTAICQIVRALEALVAQNRFENWLFLFGTVVVAEILPKKDEWDYLFYNLGLLYKGYDPNQTTHRGKRFLVPKRYVSNLDFLTPLRHLNDTIAKEILQSTRLQEDHTVLNPYDLHQKKYDRHIWHVYKDDIAKLGYTVIEYGWFLMDNITFTVEICLDHDMRTAANTYMADAAQGRPTLIPSGGGVLERQQAVEYVKIPQHQAQISLVSSADMEISASSLVLTNHGSVILQDGMNSNEANQTWKSECWHYDWRFTGGSEVIQRRASLSPTEVVFSYGVHAASKHSIYAADWKQQLKSVFSTTSHEPMIIVYKPVDIAQP